MDLSKLKSLWHNHSKNKQAFEIIMIFQIWQYLEIKPSYSKGKNHM